MDRFTMPTNLIPTVVESTNRGERSWDIYSRLLRERIVFVGTPIDSQVANVFIAQILFLAHESPEQEIKVYINSPGGEVYAGLAMYDTMQSIRPDVAAYGLGFVASMATVLLSAGAPGKRFALPNSRILIHQGSSGFRGAVPDIEIQARETLDAMTRCVEIMARHTGQPFDRLMRDTERDNYMSAEEAKEYGLIDEILLPRSEQALAARALLGAGR
jgi:ATP-dependent Clp protease protease subunit